MLNRHSGSNRFQSMQHLFFRYSVFMIVVCSGCITTRFQKSKPCPTMLKSGDLYLIPWLPKDQSEILSQSISSQFKKKNIDVRYMPAEEYSLRAAGVSNPLDSTQFTLLKKLGYSHFLLIKEISNQNESVLSYFTSIELGWAQTLYPYNPSWNERGNQSEIIIQLIPIGDLGGAHQIIVNTTIGHLTLRNKDSSETYLNVTGASTARSIAIRKGIKKLFEQCDFKI